MEDNRRRVTGTTAPPTSVGDLHWPVLCAVRVSTAADPAEFVVD